MADPQFEPFQAVFEKMPQHIKAPKYSYRLTHDISLDNYKEESFFCNGGLTTLDVAAMNESNLIKSMQVYLKNGHYFNATEKITSAASELEKNEKEKLSRQDSNNGSDSSSAESSDKENSINIQRNGSIKGNKVTEKRRRKLPEVPAHKSPLLATSKLAAMFGHCERSLADEIIEAENAIRLKTQPPLIALHRTSWPVSRECRHHPSWEDDNSQTLEVSRCHELLIAGDPSRSSTPSSGVSSIVMEYEATHRGLHKFIPRHPGELEIEIGDPLYVQHEAEDLWYEGINLRTKRSGIFPCVYATDIDYEEICDPDGSKNRKFALKYLGSIEVSYHKGNHVLCQAMHKIVKTKNFTEQQQLVLLEVNENGIRMIDKKKPSHNSMPKYDHFFSIKNVSFCGFHPKNNRYFGFVTKHPIHHRFACHVFLGDGSTRTVAEAIGQAFQKFYHDFMDSIAPIEDIYIE